MSLILLGILNSQVTAGGAIVYRLQTLGGSGTERGRGITIDSLGNIYTIGQTNSTGAGNYDFLLVKYDSSGTIQWQRTLGGSGSDYGYSVAIDSANNVYAFGIEKSSGATYNKFLLAKYDSSGTLQWQRNLGGTGAEEGYSVAIDSSDNIYLAGRSSSTGAGGTDMLIAKYSASGTLLWQRYIGGLGTDASYGVALDSADNVYVAGSTSSGGSGATDAFIAKYNSSGTIQWQRFFGGASNEIYNSLAVDSADNIYTIGWTDSAGAGSQDFLITKYSASGTLLWQRVLGGSSAELGRAIAIDSSDNLYALGYTSSAGAGSQDFLITKYSSSATIQWQRVLGATSSEIAYSIAIDSSDNLYLCGYTSSVGAGGSDNLLAVLPNDGSLTGTYALNGVDFVYATSSLTAATSSLTSQSSSLIAATSLLTPSTTSLTSASASLTEYRVDL